MSAALYGFYAAQDRRLSWPRDPLSCALLLSVGRPVAVFRVFAVAVPVRYRIVHDRKVLSGADPRFALEFAASSSCCGFERIRLVVDASSLPPRSRVVENRSAACSGVLPTGMFKKQISWYVKIEKKRRTLSCASVVRDKWCIQWPCPKDAHMTVNNLAARVAHLQHVA